MTPEVDHPVTEEDVRKLGEIKEFLDRLLQHAVKHLAEDVISQAFPDEDVVREAFHQHKTMTGAGE